MILPRRPDLGLRAVPAAAGGVLVEQLRGDAAVAAILRPGDRLLAIDDLPVDDPRALAVQLRSRRAGEVVSLRFVRDDQVLHAPVVLEALPHETCPDGHVSYDSIEVDGVRLRTITALPVRRVGPVPAVLLLPDLACVSQDLALVPGQPVRAIVARLVAAGVASMRVERPGLGDSEGGPCEALGWHDEVNLHRVALAALASHSAVDPDQLCLFGHGVGGTQAPLVAAEERARRVIVFGTCARRWSACVRRSAAGRDGDPLALAQLLTRARAGRSERYTDELEAIDLPAAWRALQADVLVLHGGRDDLTDPADARALAELLARRSHGAASYLEIADADRSLGCRSDPTAPDDALLAAITEFARSR